MFDTINIYDKDDKKVTSGIGTRSVIFYANTFEKVETYSEAIKVLEKQGLRVSKTYIMV